MPYVEIGACFPELREEFFVERGFKITDSFRSAGTALGAHHAFDHLDVMRTPEREVFIVFEQCFRKLKLFVTLLEMSKNFEHCLGACFVSLLLLHRIGVRRSKWRCQTTALQHAIETVCQCWT